VLEAGKVMDQIKKDILKDSHKTTKALRARCGVELIKRLKLDFSHGNVALVASLVNSTRVYAQKLLKAVATGREKTLYVRNDKLGIKKTDWPSQLQEFSKQPQNSRSCPGFEDISVAYGKRLPKFLALKSKVEIVDTFKKSTACPFATSTLLRVFPQNVVQPTERDLQRNACPEHANFR
jgi:hypothetical protein